MELPPEIGKLQGLTDLNLNENQLTELPKEIGQLKYLRRLELSANQLTELPEEIKQLRLESLDLSGNPFSQKQRQTIARWLPNCNITLDKT